MEMIYFYKNNKFKHYRISEVKKFYPLKVLKDENFNFEG